MLNFVTESLGKKLVTNENLILECLNASCYCTYVKSLKEILI